MDFKPKFNYKLKLNRLWNYIDEKGLSKNIKNNNIIDEIYKDDQNVIIFI